jgi:hypothetical protein
MTKNKQTVKIEQPLYTMNINQDPYHGIGGIGGSGEPGAIPEIDIRSITGVNLEQLDMPHMLEVLRGMYDREGTRYKYRSRAFRVQSQSGTVTDIQASLYNRFHYAGDQIHRLVNEIKPMIPDPDIEDCEAARALVLEAVDELVEESRWQGGPRQLKIEGTFKKLGRYLILFKDRNGLANSRARTQIEAENWANFVTIMDIYNDMRNSWALRKRDLDRTGSESYGNQVVWLNRLLNLVKEAAARLRFQLRALLVGDAEMSTKFIDNNQLTIDELLSWTTEVCDRGVMVSLRAGKDGMFSLAFDLNNLANIYANLISKIDDGCNNLPITELCEDHISQTLRDIFDALQEAEIRAKAASPGYGNRPWRPRSGGRRTDDMRDPNADDTANNGEEAVFSTELPPTEHPTFSPEVLGIFPTSGEAGTTIDIHVFGQNFNEGLLDMNWELFPDQIFQVIERSYVSSSIIRLTTRIASEPEWYGEQSLAVSMDGQTMWFDRNAFEVLPASSDQTSFTPPYINDVLGNDETLVTLEPIEIPLDPNIPTKKLVVVFTLVNSGTKGTTAPYAIMQNDEDQLEAQSSVTPSQATEHDKQQAAQPLQPENPTAVLTDASQTPASIEPKTVEKRRRQGKNAADVK